MRLGRCWRWLEGGVGRDFSVVLGDELEYVLGGEFKDVLGSELGYA